MKDKKNQVPVAKQVTLDSNSPTTKSRLLPLYHKIKNKFTRTKAILFAFFVSMFLKATPVFAVEKIEGGDITISSLGTIIKNLAKQIQVFGIVLAFIALTVFVIQFIIGDDETKQRKKKTILYTLGGVALLILVPSLINLIISTLES